ncbi:MAG: hypothetical protein U5L45_25755 [Saprospiraceae bacterium]|nr:hypothetical protein [Saprospiraceae bacterium]
MPCLYPQTPSNRLNHSKTMFYTKSKLSLWLGTCLVFTLIFFGACRSDNQKSTEILLSGIHKVTLLDSTDAAKAIVQDNLDKFFDCITAIDAAVQMKKNDPLSMSREAMVASYKDYLQTDVIGFTKEESVFVAKAMNEAFQLVTKVSQKYFPEDIRLIKTKAQHYDDEMFYTRENCIVIPEPILKQKNYDAFLQTLLHEISHIVTRLNPNLKAQLYALAGFKKIEIPLTLPDALSRRLLTNPDGVDINWATPLTSATGSTVFTMPLLYAKDTIFDPKKPDFGDYLGWNYYELAPSIDNKRLLVQTVGERQQSTLDTRGINDLFLKNYNTAYIIHPDEIVADNFSLLMLSQKKAAVLNQCTEGGKTLLAKMKEVLSQ